VGFKAKKRDKKMRGGKKEEDSIRKINSILAHVLRGGNVTQGGEVDEAWRQRGDMRRAEGRMP